MGNWGPSEAHPPQWGRHRRNWSPSVQPSDPSCLPRPTRRPGRLNSRGHLLGSLGGRCRQEIKGRSEGWDSHLPRPHSTSLPGCPVGSQLIRRPFLGDPKLLGSHPEAPCPPFALADLEMAKVFLRSRLPRTLPLDPGGLSSVSSRPRPLCLGRPSWKVIAQCVPSPVLVAPITRLVEGCAVPVGHTVGAEMKQCSSGPFST